VLKEGIQADGGLTVAEMIRREKEETAITT